MRRALESLRPGEHAVHLYRSRAEQFESVIRFIRAGLIRNERCLYVAADNPVRMVIEALEEGGIDVVKAEKEGRLRIASAQETYLKHGLFHPERMAAELTEEVERALSEGFSALRGAGEMSWAATHPEALFRLYEYEAVFDRTLSPHFLALCQYNENLFEPALISRIVRIHTVVVARGSVMNNPYYVGPEKFLENEFESISIDQLTAMPGA